MTTPEPRAHARYAVAEVADLLKLSPARIRGWVRANWITPERAADGTPRFTFRELAFLRRLRDLQREQVPARRVRRALRRLRARPETRDLAESVSTLAGRVVVRESGTLWNAESGQGLFEFGAPPEAAGSSTRVLRLEAANGPGDAAADADAWLALAGDLEGHDREGARRAYRRALDADPKSVDALVNLGCLDHEDGALAAAENHYRAASALRPDDATPAFNLAVVLEDQERHAEAAEACAVALAADPTLAEAHYNLARLLERAGDRAGALRHWRAYRELAPTP